MHLKKSGNVTIWHLVTHLEQLKRILGRLQGLANSPKANKVTTQIMPMDEAKLALILLQAHAQ